MIIQVISNLLSRLLELKTLSLMYILDICDIIFFCQTPTNVFNITEYVRFNPNFDHAPVTLANGFCIIQVTMAMITITYLAIPGHWHLLNCNH